MRTQFPRKPFIFHILIFFLAGWLAACTALPISEALLPATANADSPVKAVINPTQTVASTAAAAATHAPTGEPPTASLPTATPEASPTPEPNGVRLPPPPEHRTHYRLDATLDYAAHRLEVQESITYTNTTPNRLGSLLLVVEATRYPTTFQLAGVFDSAGRPLKSYKLKDTYLTVDLPEPLASGASVQISLSYTLQLLDVTKLPSLRPYPLGYTAYQANFGDWYPFIPPYEAGKGWLKHNPSLWGEHLVYDLADFDVSVRLAGSQTNLVIPASALASIDGEWLRYHLEQARNFAWSASPYYQALTQTVRTGEGRSAVVASYFYPLQAEAGKSLLDTMAKALPLYARLFGEYPHDTFTGVEGEFLDGQEYDGLFFLGKDFYNWHKDTQADFLVALAAHETAHQWWYGLVGSDQAMQPWLDEALCTYSERIYYENVFPDALEWWWAYRVDYYDPQGWVDTNIYDAPSVAGQYKKYRDPVYLRGSQFLEELRGVMGDEAFFASLRDYVERYAYGRADAAGFFAIFKQHTRQDLGPLISKYFAKAP